jgi:hypothetical protein
MPRRCFCVRRRSWAVRFCRLNVRKSFAQALAQRIDAIAGAGAGGLDSGLGKLQQFRKNVDDLKEHLGEILLPAFKLVVDAANRFVKRWMMLPKALS